MTASKYQQSLWLIDGQLSEVKRRLDLAEVLHDGTPAHPLDEVIGHMLAALEDLHRAVKNLDERLRVEERSYAE